MRPLLRRALLFLLILAAAPLGAAATTLDAPVESITHHQFKVGEAMADFTVTAAALAIDNDKGERPGSIFYVAYTRDQASPGRPVTFVFNGGPGSSAAYLHITALGPRVIDVGANGQLPGIVASLVDNPDHWLDLTDLVFVDPIGTGYSRAASRELARRHWGVVEDVASLASFIDRYLRATGRRNAPVYLAGESYGGFRAARLPSVLSAAHQIDVAGAMLISPVLEFSLISNDRFALLPDVMRLPSYAAVAMERSGAATPEALAEVERFALGPYLAALVATPRDPVAMDEVARQVARLTGLPETVIARHGGQVPIAVFAKEARRSDKLLSSLYDGSATGPDPDPGSHFARIDAQFDPLRALLSEKIRSYLADSLGARTEMPYLLSSGEVLRFWNWRTGRTGRDGYAGAAAALEEALHKNPAFKVMIVHGMTDLVTPYLTSRYVIGHLPPGLTRDRVTLTLHPGGHMMYLRPPSRAGLHADAARFYPAPN